MTPLLIFYVCLLPVVFPVVFLWNVYHVMGPKRRRESESADKKVDIGKYFLKKPRTDEEEQVCCAV